MIRAGIVAFAVLGVIACATLGKAPAADPAKLAADAHRASVDACKAYHAAVALGVKPAKAADDACAAAQGLCAD